MKTNTTLGLVFIAATMLCLPAGIRAQSADQSFAKEAASGGMAEVKLGQLAQANGSSDSVKQFGKRMVTDHSKANDQLKDAASRDNITTPGEIDKTDQATYDRLSKLSGAEFDKAYADEMVKDHKKDIASFKKEADSGMNPEIKQFASKTLPTLEEHLKMAEEMQKTVSESKQSSALTPATR
jgi:putative membrane protein